MKILKSLVSLALVICSFISTTAMAQNQTVINLDSIPSQRVIKDLEMGDLCKQKLIIATENAGVKDKTINKLESKINLLELGASKINNALIKKDKSIGFQTEIITNNENQISIEKRKKNFWKLTSFLMGGFIIYNYAK